MLEKKVTFDHLINENGVINVRRITRILEDGKELSKSYNRHCVAPGDHVDTEDERTKKIANVIFTPEVIYNYQKKLEESKI